MTTAMTLDAFVRMTAKIRPDAPADFVPTLVDPELREIKALEGIPDDVDCATATREWAAGQSKSHYFIAYPSADGIVAEEYLGSELVGSELIN